MVFVITTFFMLLLLLRAGGTSLTITLLPSALQEIVHEIVIKLIRSTFSCEGRTTRLRRHFNLARVLFCNVRPNPPGIYTCTHS
jgi:hypothetical protein